MNIAISQSQGEKRPDGWLSPVYGRSRKVSVDHEMLDRNRLVGYSRDAAAVEAFKMLRTKILQAAGVEDRRVIMVTSPRRGEGKTMITVNLALTFAKEFSQTVLLIDGDLKNQNIHTCLGYESEHGLGDYLHGQAKFEDLVAWPGIEKLTIVSGGSCRSESAELLNSPKMHKLMNDLKSRFKERYIIIDAPAALDSADTNVLAPMVDGIVLAVQAGRTLKKDISAALKLLPAAKILGIVVNRFSQK
ncbi:CpsD/CapB family tyrosine-protein kinase [Desulfobacterota bacterium M19]